LDTTSPPKGRSVVVAWSVYDFANSAFTTLVVTFIYSTFFANVMAADETTGQALWSRAIAISAIFVAILSPYVGTIADRGGYRRRFLLISTVVCIAGTIALYFPKPGETMSALVIFVIANIAFEMANVFYNAYLPDIASQESIGRISGYGWALGYIGGLLCMVVALFVLVNPASPPFGLNAETGEHIRATNFLVALWFAVFSIPMFLIVKDRPAPDHASGIELIRSANTQLRSTYLEIKKYRQVVRLLLARLIYNDGLITIFAFGGIYAQGVFGFTFQEIMVFGIALNVAAGLGAYAFGYIDDRIGGKKTIFISLVGLVAASALAVLTTSKSMFWVAGILVGLLAGPNQSASRSLLGRFIPDNQENEFYGFFSFSGKMTAFMGPLLLGQFTLLFDSQRAGVATVIMFFLIGMWLIRRVDEEEGVARSGRAA